jgi:hypothetical protein
MTHPDSDETGLKALFDRTAEEAGGPTLTKLRARAEDVPGLARKRRPAWLGWLAPVSALAIGAAAVTLAVRPAESPLREHTPSASVTPRTQHTAPTPAPVASASASSPIELEEDGWESELTATSLAEPVEGLVPVAFDLPEEAEIDAWLAATDQLLGEDG